MVLHCCRFTGGQISHCYNCVDRHVDNGRGEDVVMIHESPITNTMQKLTYKEFQKQVVVCIKLKKKDQSNLHYTHGITLKCVMSRGPIFRAYHLRY